MIYRAMILVLAFLFIVANISEAQVVENGLVAYWTFDKADKDAKDIVGGHDGKIFGNPKTVPGKSMKLWSSMVLVIGLKQRYQIISFADGATLEVWFYQEDGVGFGVLIKIEPDKAELNLDPERGGRSELWCYAAGGIEGPAGLRNDNWHHAVGTVSKQARHII